MLTKPPFWLPLTIALVFVTGCSVNSTAAKNDVISQLQPAGESRLAYDISHLLTMDVSPRMARSEGDNTTRGGADISVLPKYGLPVVALEQDGTYYFDYHHTANDTFDKIDAEDITQNQVVYTLFTYMMANSSIDPRPAPSIDKK